jgi:DNA-binding winged helix-turn-helix (wHTH) protein
VHADVRDGAADDQRVDAPEAQSVDAAALLAAEERVRVFARDRPETGPSSVAQRVRGLRLGADDWLTKPCHPEKLVARAETVARGRRRAEAPRTLGDAVYAGELEVRPDLLEVLTRGTSTDLTRREFELMALLADSAGRVLPREEIYHRVWGYTMAHGDRSVDVFIRKLRQKLEGASPDWRYIHTHFGIGYRFAPEPAQPPSARADSLAPVADAVVPVVAPVG